MRFTLLLIALAAGAVLAQAPPGAPGWITTSTCWLPA